MVSKRLTLSIAALALAAGPVAAQDEDPTASEAVRRARGELDSTVVTNAHLEQVAARVEAAIAELRGVPEGLDSFSGLRESILQLEHRFEEIRSSSLLGRWLGTLNQATLAWMAFPEPEYSASQLEELETQLDSVSESLLPLFQIEEGARTGTNVHAVMTRAENLLRGVDRARDEHTRRAAFLARYEAEWAAVPGTEREAFSDKPTLAMALKARLGRLLAEAHAREQAMLEELELKYAAQRARGIAEARASHLELELEQKRRMSRLTQGVLEAEFQTEVQRELSRLQHAEEKAARLAAERERQAAELRLELQRTKSHVLDLEKAIDTIEAESKLDALPPEIIGRVRLLSAPGFWQPRLVAPCHMDHAARYESIEPVPHSLTALTAAGCLDETPDGLWALYVVLASPFDAKRPRMQLAGWPPDLAWDSQQTLRRLQDQPSAYKMLREVQEALRRFGDDLVELGHLQR